jgi:hypothetical protein
MVKAEGKAYGMGTKATMVRLSIPGTYRYLNPSGYEADASVPNRSANDHGGYGARSEGVVGFPENGDKEPQFVHRIREYERYRASRAAGCPDGGRIHGITC